ncbi:putative outer membrane protein [Candidatus Moduliflexus flocculans]|uniref:Putative outer membrane protein n=1 Tax=Candidatus Moduliflexus flocculans TaxID=1499966 RepID=A0A081BTC1_9BACT|nr:putative outer membrane protein [Candidatus Moduliflexus flocculans]
MFEFYKKTFIRLSLATITVSMCWVVTAMAEEAPTQEPEELPLFEEIPVVVTASQKPERITAAPSIISVITEEDIERMGARTITDVLRTIPGIDIVRDTFGVSQIVVRGLGIKGTSGDSAGVKILIDGHALNDPFTGGATKYYDDLSLLNVRRIEVIRGPASAIYGSNAFVSVVNILTKHAQEINGIETGMEIGSDHTYHPTFLIGKTVNDLELVLSADYLTTDGAKLSMAADTASIFDELSGAEGYLPASLAPGTYRDTREKLDLSWKFNWNDLAFTGKILEKQTGPFLTDWYMLNDASSEDMTHVYAEFAYDRYLTERVEFDTRAYMDFFELTRNQEVAQGLTILSEDQWITYPDGLILDAYEKSQRFGAEARWHIRLSSRNDLTIGTAYEYFQASNLEIRTNVDSPDTVQDITNIYPNFQNASYQHFFSMFAQDSWRIHRDIDVTLGMRGDYFNDFGGIFTPKVGVTYEPNRSNLNFKALFGSAFRIPSFGEMLLAFDNEDEDLSDNLILEELRTFEIGVGYKPVDWFIGELNYFYSDINQLVQISKGDDTGSYPIGTTRIYNNIGGIDTQGIEAEIQGTYRQEIQLGIHPRALGTSFRMNYSYVDAQDTTTHAPVPYIPHHKGNVGLGLLLEASKETGTSSNSLFRLFNDELSLFFNVLLLGERARLENDTRSPLPGIAICDLTFTAHEIFRHNIEFSVSAKNLFDQDYRDPAPVLVTLQGLETSLSDIPNPGRMIFAEIRVKF